MKKGGETIAYSKIEYYENGVIKSIEIKGIFMDISGNLDDFKQKKI